MSLIQRLLGTGRDPRENLRPLWHRVVEISRDPHWYAQDGVADTIPGRFDMITALLTLVILRMEKDADLAPSTALLTELFVEDMDGQLREGGVGDLMVGKRIGNLVAALGGRLGAYRDGLASEDPALLRDAIARNMTMVEGRTADSLAESLRSFAEGLATVDGDDILAARITR
ncbi:hypothetical protein GRI97_18180 [Altererythrobacter xixiisoli]|uniref:Ubiquinol-cytochrome c chaperone domain-containing protein n=1 Tax=Croceibacterium xixiisoli TaxID=1476466 RepID=A0A6I4U252_9SPHN|nr:ubiquinol-cytochrome C chaperone family protein [Croceibacterium xixiisoli]MXP00919.1 hypothetical protein [Croceibacterium xixiisoli]